LIFVIIMYHLELTPKSYELISCFVILTGVLRVKIKLPSALRSSDVVGESWLVGLSIPESAAELLPLLLGSVFISSRSVIHLRTESHLSSLRVSTTLTDNNRTQLFSLETF
jgi:hypothetical protein